MSADFSSDSPFSDVMAHASAPIIERYAAFTSGGSGGNPAGVAICDAMPSDKEMQSIALKVGYSETVFAAPSDDGWRVRYFAPALEIPFCGHATIALGAALARRHGSGQFRLHLNGASIVIHGRDNTGALSAAFKSPPTSRRDIDDGVLRNALELFGYSKTDLDPRIVPAIVNGGSDHLVIALKERAALSGMTYDTGRGAELMRDMGIATIALIVVEANSLIHARNAFAAGGLVEDPATGSAAAGLGGHLAAMGWPSRAIKILQGEDMGVPCELHVELPAGSGEGAIVLGDVRILS